MMRYQTLCRLVLFWWLAGFIAMIMAFGGWGILVQIVTIILTAFGMHPEKGWLVRMLCKDEDDKK